MAYDMTNKYSVEFLREMSIEQLMELLNKAQFAFFELRQQCSLGGRKYFTKKPHLFNKIKRDIAKVKTLIAEKTHGRTDPRAN